MKVAKLRAALKRLGLPQDGLKGVLLERLFVALEQLAEDPYINSPSKKVARPHSSVERSTSNGTSRKRKAETNAAADETAAAESNKTSSKRGKGEKKKKSTTTTKEALSSSSAAGNQRSTRSTRSTRSSARLKGIHASVPVEDPLVVRRSSRRSARSTRSSVSNNNNVPARATRSSTRSGRKFRKSPGPVVPTRSSRNSLRQAKNIKAVEEEEKESEEEEEEEQEGGDGEEDEDEEDENDEKDEKEEEVEDVDVEDMDEDQEDEAPAQQSVFVPRRRAVARALSPRAKPGDADVGDGTFIDPAAVLRLQEKMALFEKREAAKSAKEREDAARVLRLESENKELHQMLKEQAIQAEERQKQQAAEAAAAVKAAAEEAVAKAAADAAAKAVAEASLASSLLSVSAAVVRPVQPAAKYGSHIVSTGAASSALVAHKADESPPVTTSVPVVRMFMGMDRDPHKHSGDNEMSVMSSADEQEDPRMPRADSAFAPFPNRG